jgi:hypothetical protein
MDRSGATVIDETREVSAESFGSDRRSPVVYDLPLTRLRPGEYLATFDVALHKQHVQRTVTFEIAGR